jgi:hypothetical protein
MAKAGADEIRRISDNFPDRIEGDPVSVVLMVFDTIMAHAEDVPTDRPRITCELCRHWAPWEETMPPSKKDGQCRRRAALQYRPWAPTFRSEWCGEAEAL